MSMSTIGVPLEGFGVYCRAAAAEGAVLLKNEGHMFPLKKEEMVSVFGRCQFETYRSGSVTRSTFVVCVWWEYTSLSGFTPKAAAIIP